MIIYMTTEPKPNRAGLYRCEIWMQEPRQGCTIWFDGGTSDPSSCRVAKEDLAALGFPPPSKMLVHEIPPYEDE